MKARYKELKENEHVLPMPRIRTSDEDSNDELCNVDDLNASLIKQNSEDLGHNGDSAVADKDTDSV